MPSRKKPCRSFSATEGAVFQIKIRLLRISPMVWRRVLVPASFTLHEFHGVIQAVMGWEGLHLFQFQIRAVAYGSFDLMIENPTVPLESFGFRKNGSSSTSITWGLGGSTRFGSRIGWRLRSASITRSASVVPVLAPQKTAVDLKDFSLVEVRRQAMTPGRMRRLSPRGLATS